MGRKKRKYTKRKKPSSDSSDLREKIFSLKENLNDALRARKFMIKHGIMTMTKDDGTVYTVARKTRKKRTYKKRKKTKKVSARKKAEKQLSPTEKKKRVKSLAKGMQES